MSYLKGDEETNPSQRSAKDQRGRPTKKSTKSKKNSNDGNQPAKPATVIPNLIKCVKHDTKCQQDANLQDFIDEVYQIQEVPIIETFANEDDEGNVQYKLKLIKPTPERIEQLTTQMKFRVHQGFGEAYYRVGVEDNGKPTGLCKQDMLESLKTICKVAQKIKADVIILRVSQGIKGKITELMIRKTNMQGAQLEIRALLFGESLSGKSTLLGVLRSGELDDGKGRARRHVSSNPYELITGTTQTVRHETIGFDSNGKISNQTMLSSWESFSSTSTKIVTMIDIGGHKKAEKQIVSSLCSYFPEYAILVLSAVTSKLNPQPIHLAKVFNLPLIVVITHIDVCRPDQLREFIYNVKVMLRENCQDKTATIIKTPEDAVLLSVPLEIIQQIVVSEAVIPIFPLSSVTGDNLSVFISFLNLLPSVSDLRNNADMPTEFLVSEKFVVNGKIILAGTVIKGNINKGQILQLGPDGKGNFRAVEIVDIRCANVQVKYAKSGQTCTLHIRPLNYCRQWLEKEPNGIRRGMVLVESKTNPRAAYQFQCEIDLYHRGGEVTISRKYQPVINTLTTRQSCKIVQIKLSKQEQFDEFPQLGMKKQKSRSICGRTNKNEVFTSKKSLVVNRHGQPKRSHDFSAQKNYEQVQKPTKKPLQKIQQEGIGHRKRRQKEQITLQSSKPQSFRFRFKYYPQYISVGQRLVINDGLLKAMGRITDIYY